jgi:hypothetical protein
MLTRTSHVIAATLSSYTAGTAAIIIIHAVIIIAMWLDCQ